MRQVSCLLRRTLSRLNGSPGGRELFRTPRLPEGATSGQIVLRLVGSRGFVLFPSLCSVDPVDSETLLSMLENPEDREVCVKVVDSNGDSLGTMSLADAKKLAFRRELRLVHFGAEGVPPVPLYKLQVSTSGPKEKHQKREAKHKVLRLHATISEHDFMVKTKHLLDMLNKGCVVRVEVSGNKFVEFNALSLISRLKTELDGIAKFGPTQGTIHHAVVLLSPRQSS
uniref:Translation initiation factor 3 N-terminal domain-containing protein n=1 Tax=Trichuris muris TaxID=70415 RepID=A0A5S6QI60_TRIMR